MQGVTCEWLGQYVHEDGIFDLYLGAKYSDADLSRAIEQATLAERDRCEQIARDMDYGMGEIAEAIRSGK